MAEAMQAGGSDPAQAETIASTPSAETAAQPENEADQGAAETEAEPSPDAGAEPEPAKKQSRGFQKRIDELTARTRDTERDRDYWREMAMRGGHQPAERPGAGAAPTPLPPEVMAQIGPPPKPEDFQLGEFDPKYAPALARHEIRIELAQAALQQQRQHQQHANAQYLGTLAEKISAASERLPGLSVDSVVSLGEQLPGAIGNQVAALIVGGDEGADVAHWLVENPSEVRRLAAMSPVEAAFELGEARARIKAARQAASATKAPAPPRMVGTGRAPSTPNIHDPGLSIEAYAKARGLG